MEKKITAVLIVLLAIVGLVLGYFVFLKPKYNAVPVISNPSKEANIGQKSEKNVSDELGKTTGKVDEISSNIVNQLETEEDKFSAEDSETDVIIDQSTLDDFGQSYDEKEL